MSARLVGLVVPVGTPFLPAVFGIFAYAIDQVCPLAMAVNTLVVLEIFHLLVIRNLRRFLI